MKLPDQNNHVSPGNTGAFMVRGFLATLPILLAASLYIGWTYETWTLPLLACAALIVVPAGLAVQSRLLRRAATAPDPRQQRTLAKRAYIANAVPGIILCPLLILKDSMGLWEALTWYASLVVGLAASIALMTPVLSWFTQRWSGKSQIESWYERNAPREEDND